MAKASQHPDEALRSERGSGDTRGLDPAASSPMLLSDESVTDEFWKNPVNLEAPPPRPGYVQRWIRVGIQGTDDATNHSKAMRLGWRPRRVDTVDDTWKHLSTQHGDMAGVISVHGMILCERPKAIDDQHKAHIRAVTDRQTRAVMSDLAQMENRRMPVSIQMKTQVERGGRVPRVARDPDSTPD